MVCDYMMYRYIDLMFSFNGLYKIFFKKKGLIKENEWVKYIF